MSAANVKRAPATALPWAQDSDAPSKGTPRAMVFPENDAGGDTLVAGRLNPQDADYIVHAANAYPKLVEALRSGIASLEQFVKLNRIPENNHGLREMRALLRELGEE